MTDLLWQKSGIRIDERIMRFLAADDVVLDREFLLHDIEASKAHVAGLGRIGIVDADEVSAIARELDGLAEDFRAGRFVLDARYEDGHSAIEARLIERLGDAGRKVHTGRSRNDQILVATRLWLKAKLSELVSHCAASAAACLDRATRETLPMPGYTHLQRAVVSSTALWFAGFAEAFIDDARRAQDTLAWIDANPLGTAAGYGVNLPLDRAHTTEALGFARLQVNPVYAQLSRGKYEIGALDALGTALLDLRRLAWDLSLFTTAEFDFVRLPPEYTTGSSIMPNKRNPDVVELMRASYASVAAARSEIEHLLSLPSGYQRDLQFSKGALFHGFTRGLAALELLPDLLARIEWNAPAMRAAIEPSMYATDVAIEQAAAGVPFRDAYRHAADAAASAGQGRTPEASLAARVSPGASADLRLDDLKARLRACVADVAARRFSEQSLPAWRRAVLKVGSSLLSDTQGTLSERHARGLANFIASARAQGKEVVLVSSGAVAAGRARVPDELRRSGGLVLRQALAALGQTRMVGLWQGLLDAPTAQVLLSHDDLRNRRRYLNARNTLLELLRLGAVPVINENDTVAVEELKLGDNDNLAAIVAALVDADLLLIASDVDGLYSAHPQHDASARPIDAVESITPAVFAMAGDAGSSVGTGGMRTKLEAAAKAANAGIATVLFSGADPDTVALLASGRFCGTCFSASGTRLAARKYWLRHAPGSGGRIRVDAGAARAVLAGASLLPGGIVGIEGEFVRGDLVEVVAVDADVAAVVARGLCQYAAGEVRRLAGRHTRDIETILGFSYGDTVIRRDDLVAWVETAP